MIRYFGSRSPKLREGRRAGQNRVFLSKAIIGEKFHVHQKPALSMHAYR